MRRTRRVLVTFLLAAMALTGLWAGNDFNTGLEMNWAMYGGLHLQQYDISGFRNARLSDYQRWGAQEGSLYLPLESANGKGMAFGFTAGARADLENGFEVLAEMQMDFPAKNSYFLNLQAGAVYNFINSNFKLGAGAKVGYYIFNRNLGTADILPGTRPPVNLAAGTIKQGDRLSYMVSGISITPVVDLSYKVGKNIAVGFSGGYQIGIQISDKLTAGEKVNISPDKNPEAYYDPEAEGFERITLNPKVSVNGFTGIVYCTYVF